MASKSEKDQRYQCSQLDLDLPLDASKETDWNTIGDKLVLKLINEANYISCVDRKNGTKSSVGGKANGGWEYSYEKDNVQVFRKTTHQTSFAGRGIIETPLENVAAFIKDLESGFIWKKFIAEIRCERMIVDSEQQTDYIAYEMYESNRYCGLLTFKREMLYFLRCSFIDGRYVQSAVSVDAPERPKQPDVPRVDVYPGTGFVLDLYKGDASKTLVTFFGNVDLKGLPSFMMSQVLKRYPLLLRYIRQHFAPPRIPSPTHLTWDASISPLPWNQHITQDTESDTTETYEDTVPCQHYIHHQNSSNRQYYKE